MKKSIFVVGTIIFGWYSLQILRIFFDNEVQNALPISRRTSLIKRVICTTEQLAGKPISKEELKKFLSKADLSSEVNIYTAEIEYSCATNWIVCLIPQIRAPYDYKWYWRVITLDFHRTKYPNINVGFDKNTWIDNDPCQRIYSASDEH